MILTDDEIRAAVAAGDIGIDPFDDAQIQPASIDLRVGDEGATSKDKKKVNIRQDGLIVLEPADFGVVTLLEYIKFGPGFVGRMGLRSKYARKGLIATTGPQIDPGFEGTITVGLVNLAPKPISLSHGDDLLTLEIHRLAQPAAKPYEGPYQGKRGLSPDALDHIIEGEGMAFSEVLTSLRVLTQNVSELSGQVKGLKDMVPLYVTIAIGVIAIIVAIK